MDRTDKRIRIGRINYTNVWPIFHYFSPEELSGKVEMISQVPTQLNAAMVKGDMDIGPISSFAYGEHFRNYLLFPDLSVSALGPVKSILLFHKKPFESIINGNIALTTASATSVNLLKIIIARFYGGRPKYCYVEPVLEKMLEEGDAALLIGDDAIRAHWSNRQYEVTDLGELWNRHTGCWMSFAVWAIRKSVAEEDPQTVKTIYDAFQRSKRLTAEHPEPMIDRALTLIGGTENYWRDYFANLCYDFDSRQKEGLALYYRYAYESGLLPQEVRLQVWNEKSIAR